MNTVQPKKTPPASQNDSQPFQAKGPVLRKYRPVLGSDSAATHRFA